MKKIIGLFSAILVMAATQVFAISSDDLIVKEYSKKATAGINVISDQAALNVTYTGASTQCVVAVGSGSITTYLPGPDTTQDINYNLAAAAYNTMGELCDAIDAQDDYVCALKDAKRDDNSIYTMNIAAVIASNAKAVGGYNVLIDSGPILVMGGTANILRLGITPATGKQVVLKYCIGNINVTDTLRVWGKLAKHSSTSDGVTRNDSTLVYKAITADDTDKTLGNIYGVDWIAFAKDEHVVIGSYDDDTQQAAANLIECVWDEK